MFIRKSGISREINEKDLQVYRDKGYSVVTKIDGASDEKEEKKKPAREKRG